MKNLMKSAYACQPGVRIDAAGVPEQLRPLLPLAEQWAFVGETATFEKVDCAPTAELQHFVEAFQKSLLPIHAFCFGPLNNQVPIPDEVAVFQIALTTYQEAEPVLRSRLQKGRKT